MEFLTDDNFELMCAKHYDNPHCISTDEFKEDLNRVKYIKKLLTRYESSGELRERLILNHIIVLTNVFGPEFVVRILYLQIQDRFHMIKPFLILTKVLPKYILCVGHEQIIDTDDISMDPHIVQQIKDI